MHLMRKTEGFPFQCLGLQTVFTHQRTVFNFRLTKMEAKNSVTNHRTTLPHCHWTVIPLDPAVFTHLIN